MPRFKTREYLSEYKGMKNVVKATYENGVVSFYTKGWRFCDEANSKGACQLGFIDNDFGFFLHLFNSNNETVGVYKMHSGLRGFTSEELVEQRNRLHFCKVLNLDKDFWETYVYGNPIKVTAYKESCGLATILKDDKWSVIDRNNNYIVPPGKYDYIDGFDKCGLARVKKNGTVNFVDSSKSTKDRWGLIDTKGNEVLELKYDEIWAFCGKNRKTTRVVEKSQGIDGGGESYTQESIFEYRLDTKRLVEVGYWIDDEYYETVDDNDSSGQYSIWDALDGEPEAAGNIDYEW